MKKPSACLIYNPFSGSSDPKDDLYKIRVLLEDAFNLDIRFIREDVDGDDIAQQILSQGGVDLFIASGGDGTVSAVANSLMGTNIPLGVIPRGTANAFSIISNIPRDITNACLTIIEGKTRFVDVARCNGRSMLVQVGVGFEPEMIRRSKHTSKSQWGILAYIYSGIQEWRKLNSFEVELEIEQEITQFQASAITVANAAPAASVLAQGPPKIIPNDGLLDVTVFAPEGRIQALMASLELILSAVGQVAVRRHDVIHFRTPELKVTTHPSQSVSLDGEVREMNPLEIESLKQSLKIIVPGGMEEIPIPSG